ncbi:MAG: hypothetical protein ABIR33_02555 [Pyrinomonadaceae bacterium]
MNLKSTVVVCLLVAIIPAALGFWYLNKELPTVDPPRLPIDDRTSLDPDLNFLQSSTYWDEEILRRFNEQPLSAIDSGSVNRVYRLILMPTFDRPVCVRVESKQGRKTVAIKVLDGLGGYGAEEYGKFMSAKERALTEQEWTEIERLIESSSFWYIPRIDIRAVPVTDGATWVLEGATDSYHLVERITPSPQLEELMVYLLELSGVKNDYQGYYQAQ